MYIFHAMLQVKSSTQAPEIVPTCYKRTPSGINIPQRPATRQRFVQPEFSRADHGGLDPTQMEIWGVQCQQWKDQTSMTVPEMVGCAWCGRMAMGGQYSLHRALMRKIVSNEIPPAAAANPVMAAYMTEHVACAGEGQSPTTEYWSCQACRKSENRRASQYDLHSPRYCPLPFMKVDAMKLINAHMIP
jgi:hypothetical protein